MAQRRQIGIDWHDVAQTWSDVHEAGRPYATAVAQAVPFVAPFISVADTAEQAAVKSAGVKVPSHASIPLTPSPPASPTARKILQRAMQRPPDKSRIVRHPLRTAAIVGGGVAVGAGLAWLLIHLARR